MRRLRIAIVIEAWFPYLGGGQVYVQEVAQRLIKQYDWRVDIITRSLRDDGNSWREREERFGGKMRILRFGPALPFENVFGRLLFLFQALWFLLWHRYDLLNPQSFLPGFPAKLAGAIRRVPVVYTIHGTVLFLPQPTGVRKKIERWVEEFLLLRIRYDAEVTVAKNFLSLPNANKKIVVIPNGVDTGRFDAINVPKAPVFTLLFVGRFDPVKGLADLLQAVALTSKERDVKFRLVMVGNGPEEFRLREIVRTQQLENIVEFRGKLEGESIIREYKSAHLFVLPSHSEGAPLTLLEAFAAKIPVLATRVGDVVELVREDENGFLVESGNPRALANAIIRAYRTPKLSNLGQRGYELVRTQYQWQNTAQKLVALFEEVLSGRQPVTIGKAGVG